MRSFDFLGLLADCLSWSTSVGMRSIFWPLSLTMEHIPVSGHSSIVSFDISGLLYLIELRIRFARVILSAWAKKRCPSYRLNFPVIRNWGGIWGEDSD